jgi:hypothetical protein
MTRPDRSDRAVAAADAAGTRGCSWTVEQARRGDGVVARFMAHADLDVPDGDLGFSRCSATSPTFRGGRFAHAAMKDGGRFNSRRRRQRPPTFTASVTSVSLVPRRQGAGDVGLMFGSTAWRNALRRA